MFRPKKNIARIIGTVCLAALMHPVWSQFVEKMPEPINTSAYDEFAPVISSNGEFLFFTRVGSPDFERTLIYGMKDLNKTLSQDAYMQALADIYGAISGDAIIDPVSSNFNQDIWIATMKADSFVRLLHPGFPLNNALPNSAEAFIENPDRLILINEFPKEGGIEEGISSVRVVDGSWFSISEPTPIKHFYNLSTEMSLSISADGTLLVLAIEKDDSRGNMDLYLAVKRSDGGWGTPRNLTRINTPYRETTPYITADKKRIYFASNRQSNSDELDIYVSKRSGDGHFNWSEPERLPSPINSEKSDFQPYVDKTNGYLYFASTRDGTSDLFRYQFRRTTVLKSPIKINGTVVDASDGKAIRAAIYYHPKDKHDKKGFFRSANGKFEAKLKTAEAYLFYAQKAGYKSDTVILDNWWEKDIDYELQINVGPIDHSTTPVVSTVELNQEKDEMPVDTTKHTVKIQATPALKDLQLSNVLFYRTTARFLPESNGDLNHLLRTMRKYPDLNILISGHTDNNGTSAQLYELSVRRAHAVQRYLVSRGIELERTAIAGFGEKNPRFRNNTAYNRRLNRRVEITVMDK